MSYPSKDEYYLSKIREERGKVEQLEKDKQELIDCLKDIAEYTNPPMRDRSGGCFYKAKKSLEKHTGKSIEELLK